MPDANGFETEDEARARARATFAATAIPTATLNTMRAAGVTPLASPADAVLPAFAQPGAVPTGPVASDEPPPEPPAQAETPMSAAPAAMPARARVGGGGGGGGGGGLPAGPTVGQTLAHGAQLTADEQERDVISEKVANEQGKAALEVTQDQAEARREAELQKQQQELQNQLTADLKAKQDILAKDTIHDQFDGHPLKAVLAALASGLGAFSATMSGGVNHAQGILDRSAEMYRQKELHRFEQEEKAVGGAEGAVQRAEVRADVATAALYRQFTRDRERILRAHYGADDARIANDALLQQNSAKAAAHEQGWQDGVANIARQEVNDRAQRAAQYASAGHANAETKKTLAEAAQIEAGNGPGSAGAGGRAAGVMIQKATLAEHGAAALQTVDEALKKGIDLSDADRKKIQDNVKEMQGSDHMGPLAAKLARGTVLARSPYEGLSPEKQKLAMAYEILAQKGAAITSPSHAEDEMRHARGMFDLLAPGEEQSIRRQKLSNLRGVIGAARGLGGKYSDIATQGATAGQVPAKGALPPLTPIQRAQTMEWLKANSNDPRAGQARARLLE